MNKPKFFSLHANPSKRMAIFLMLIPFIILIAAYVVGSEYRHSVNPKDKLMPTVEKMYNTTISYAIKKDRKGNYVLLNDIPRKYKEEFLGWFGGRGAPMIGGKFAIYSEDWDRWYNYFSDISCDILS